MESANGTSTDSTLANVNPNHVPIKDAMQKQTCREAATPALHRQPAPRNHARSDNARFWLSAIVDSSDYAIVGNDLNGLVTSWNKAAEAMFGYAAGEIIGQPITRIVPLQGIDEEASIIDRIHRSEKIVPFETMRQCKDGALIPVSLTVSPVRDDQGRLIGTSKIARDLTDMQRVHSDLERREALLRSILDTVPDALIVISSQGRINSFSAAAARLFGYGADEMVSQDIGVLLVAPDREQYDSYWTRYLSTHEPRIVGIGRRKDFSTFPMELVIGDVHLADTQLCTAFVRDLTERDEREQEQRAANAESQRLARHLAKACDAAERSNQAKSRFLASMSHELRTPLSGILGYAQLLRTEGGLNAAQGARVNAMLEAGKHLLEMITSVLNLSEIEAGHVELRPLEVDVRAVAAACLNLVRPAAEAKGLALRLALAPGARQKLITDPVRLRQVLLNLLGNAVKFTARGAVELRLQPAVDDSTLRIEVVDSGRGIPADQRQRMFQDFERLDIEANSTVEGAGLGLALSSRLARLLGGRLGHSDNPGGGSVFWLELPLDAGAASVLATAPAADVATGLAESTSAPALHVLVVDDMAMNREIASGFLRAAGHDVDCVEAGAQAVAAVASADFDVVLMDVRMPGMDGLEATRRIRALGGARALVPIVALTAQAFAEQVEECRQEGMDGHLAKPFEPAALLTAVVNAAIAGRVRGQRLSPAFLPTTVPVAPRAIGSELPVLEPRTFERTASFLAPGAVASYLEAIAARGEAMLRNLREPGALARDRNELAKAAHTLAGSGSMFGFERLAAIGLRFEQAVQTGATELAALADPLSAAIEASLPEMRARMPPAMAA